MPDKIISSYFKNVYKDENGNLVMYANQIHDSLESALKSARDRQGWKYLYTVEIACNVYTHDDIIVEDGNS